jgi:RNA polymerase sigma factor (sigma-70 family)
MQPQAENQVRGSVDHLFRHQAGQMVSVLSRIFGVQKIDLIEDAVQDALVAALKKWPFGGIPENPPAWLIQTAKNRILDNLRREKKSESIDDDHLDDSSEGEIRFSGELNEDQLRMIFACCHPAIPPDSQVALTLKIVGGFGVSEIARAYLANDGAVAKMLTRAKSKLRTVGFEIPAKEELHDRLDAVLRVLYLMFNEGYTASTGDELIRKDLCFEAIRLARIVANHPVTSHPKIHALTALFLFQAARLSTRSDHRGELLLLADQNRFLWDKEMLAAGLVHFRRSASGAEISEYHIEAEIASLHALTPDFRSTDWNRILECYDILQSQRFSPVVALNRAVVVGQISGPEAALIELSKLAEHYLMTSFNLFHLTRAHFLAELGCTDEAKDMYLKAETLTRNESVVRFIQKRIAD